MKIKEAILVEGKYDKNMLAQCVDATIIQLDGFGLFKSEDKKNMIRKLAETCGIIIMTDSDGAGLVIRNHIKGIVPPTQIKNAYIPQIYGKEKRKLKPSKEGFIGVEGMNREIIIKALIDCGATIEDNICVSNIKHISKADLFELGLSGKPNSKELRTKLLIKLNLPKNISTNSMLEVINRLYSYEEILTIIGEL